MATPYWKTERGKETARAWRQRNKDKLSALGKQTRARRLTRDTNSQHVVFDARALPSEPQDTSHVLGSPLSACEVACVRVGR